jgi:hypothetical protein
LNRQVKINQRLGPKALRNRAKVFVFAGNPKRRRAFGLIHGRWENLQILVVMPAAVLDWDDVVNVVLDSGLLRERVGGFSHLFLNQKIVVWMEQISFERSTA